MDVRHDKQAVLPRRAIGSFSSRPDLVRLQSNRPKGGIYERMPCSTTHYH